jgi:Lrp/AsnC family transcriptional regulator for asnA, asnC and gidA
MVQCADLATFSGNYAGIWFIVHIVVENNSVQRRLDSLDLGIVSILQKNGRTTTKQLASSLNSTEMTVRKRLKRLLESKVLAVKAVIEPAQLGYAQEAVLNLRVNVGYIETAAVTLTSFPEVHFVAITGGAYDIVCTVVLPEPADLLRFTSDKVSRI